MKKLVDELNLEDISQYKVWRFLNDDDIGELVVSPVKKLPVKDLTGKVIFAPVRLANGNEVFAMFGNINIKNSELTKHFMSISFLKNGHWFHLARYHDREYSLYGSEQLATFLNLKVSDIFPIEYDIAFAVKEFSEVLVGKFYEKPEKTLTRAEVIALAVP